MKLKNQFLILIFSIIALSCSKDEDETNAYDKSVKISISKVTATSVEFSLNTNGGSYSNLNYGVRKKGDSEFILGGEYGTYASKPITNLEPAQAYEATLLVKGLETFPYEILTFTTPPFDYIANANSSAINDIVYSENEFKHIFKLGFEEDYGSVNPDFKLFLSDTLNGDRVDLDFKINQNILEFTIPSLEEMNIINSGSSTYHLKYELNNGEIAEIRSRNGYFYDDFLLKIYPNKPFFKSTTGITIDNNNKCNGNTAFKVTFIGNFFGDQFSDSRFKVTQKNIFLTKKDTGKEIIFSDDIENQFDRCTNFYRQSFSNSAETKNYGGFLSLSFPKSELLGFTTGEYSIRMTFIVDGKFYETNEFDFSLKNMETLAGNTYQLNRTIVIEGTGNPQIADLNDCQLKENYIFNADGTFVFQSFKPEGSSCEMIDNINGTYQEIEQDNLEIKKFALQYEATPSDSRPYEFTILGSKVLEKGFEGEDSNGVAIKVYNYYIK